MSDISAPPARPVSLFTVVLLLAVFAAFLLVIRYYYQPSTVAAYNAAPENLSKDAEWRATADARRKALAELRLSEDSTISTYAWIDRKAGVVRLPIERAMELTVQQYGTKK
jgi:hypothetical protein